MRVGLDNVNQLLGQIVLRTLVVVLENGGADLGWRNRQHRTHQPVGAAPESAKPHEIHVFVRDTAEETIDILGLQEATLCCGGGSTSASSIGRQILPLGYDAADILIVVAMRLARTAAILCLLTAPGHLLTGAQHSLPAVLTLGAPQGLGEFFVDQQLAALDTDASQDLQDHLVKLDVIDGAGQLVVAEVAGAAVIREATRAAELAVL